MVLLVGGLFSFTQLDIEAYPDPVQPMTEVLTLPGGYSAGRSGAAGYRSDRIRDERDAAPEIDGIDLALWIIRCSNVFRLGQ